MSLTIDAPSSSAARATAPCRCRSKSGSDVRRDRAQHRLQRASSSAPPTGRAPGASTRRRCRSCRRPRFHRLRDVARAHGIERLPPSEKESGVTLITPITKVRGPSTRGARPGIGTVNDRSRSGDHSCASGLRIGSIGGTMDGRLLLLRAALGRPARRRRRVVERMAVGQRRT
jgi:hypothetical protein